MLWVVSSVTYLSCVHFLWAIGRELGEELSEVCTSEKPLEGLRSLFVTGLETEKAIFDLGEGREIVGGRRAR